MALLRVVCLVGAGLIGSSVARAIKEHGLCERVHVMDQDPHVLERVRALGFADLATDSAVDAVSSADLVMLCVPVGQCGTVAQAIAPHLRQGAIVTDVGSVKAAVIADVVPRLPTHVAFVPAHPVAGTENSGPDAGFSSLFRGRWCILTPDAGTPPSAVMTVRRLWEGMGALVEDMSAEHHDLVLAVTSHLPHLIAYNIVGTADDLRAVTGSEVIKFSAGGFRDFTRLAASDPTMWRDVFLNNREAVLTLLDRFLEDLGALRTAIAMGDGQTLFDLFTRTRAIRRSIIELGQETPQPDFGRRSAQPQS